MAQPAKKRREYRRKRARRPLSHEELQALEGLPAIYTGPEFTVDWSDWTWERGYATRPIPPQERATVARRLVKDLPT